MTTYYGWLFSKLDRIGSRSEGPEYFLQGQDYSVIRVIKKTYPWVNDKNLHQRLGSIVAITGTGHIGGLEYESVEEIEHFPKRLKRPSSELSLELDLGFDEPLYINKQPTDPKDVLIKPTLIVTAEKDWYSGTCPSSQLFDFSIEKNENVLVKWSDGMVFADVITPVIITPDTNPLEYGTAWEFSPYAIPGDGTYSMTALFVASGDFVSKDFEVKIAV
jgi:hypothetical protein